MCYAPFLKGGETWRREIKGKMNILFTQREMYMKIPSSESWHHLVVNRSCFRDQSFLRMVLTVLRLSWPEKAMAPHSSTLAWKIPRTEEPGRLQSMRSRRVGHSFIFHFHALEKEMATHSSVLAWRIPGTGEPGGLRSVGWHRVGHD